MGNRGESRESLKNGETKREASHVYRTSPESMTVTRRDWRAKLDNFIP